MVQVYYLLTQGGALSVLVVNQMVEPYRTIYTDGDALQWLIDIAHGLAFLHHQCDPPVIHRDIKLDNILLSRGGCGSGGSLGNCCRSPGGVATGAIVQPGLKSASAPADQPAAADGRGSGTARTSAAQDATGLVSVSRVASDDTKHGAEDVQQHKLKSDLHQSQEPVRFVAKISDLGLHKVSRGRVCGLLFHTAQ